MNEYIDIKETDFELSYHYRLPHEEQKQADGTIKTIGVIVKQTSFLIILDSKKITLENAELECTLVYDNDTYSEVNYITQKPISFNSFLNSTMKMNIESKILVLSSQHEDLCFRIRFDLFDTSHNSIISLYSEPLKVVSKADYKRKTKSSLSTNQFNQNNQSEQLHQIDKIDKQDETKMPKLPQSLKRENKSSLSSMSISPFHQNQNHINDTQKKYSEIIFPGEEDEIMKTVYYQQELLKEVTNYSDTNPIPTSLSLVLDYYSALPQNQRIIQLMRFISSLPPEDLNVMNELLTIFRMYQKP